MTDLAAVWFVDSTTTPPAVLPAILVTDANGDQVLLAPWGLTNPTGSFPLGVDIAFDDPAGVNIIVTANHDDDTITIIREDITGTTTTTTPVAERPFDIVIPTVAGPMFVTSISGAVSVIPAPFDTVGWTIPIGSEAAFGAYSAALNRFFVTAPFSGELVSIALTPAATGGGDADDAGGLAATGAGDAESSLALALSFGLIGAALMAASRRRRALTEE